MRRNAKFDNYAFVLVQTFIGSLIAFVIIRVIWKIITYFFGIDIYFLDFGAFFSILVLASIIESTLSYRSVLKENKGTLPPVDWKRMESENENSRLMRTFMIMLLAGLAISMAIPIARQISYSNSLRDDEYELFEVINNATVHPINNEFGIYLDKKMKVLYIKDDKIIYPGRLSITFKVISNHPAIPISNIAYSGDKIDAIIYESSYSNQTTINWISGRTSYNSYKHLESYLIILDRKLKFSIGSDESHEYISKRYQEVNNALQKDGPN